MDIKPSKTNIRKQVGGSLLTSILSLRKTLLPTLGKSALAGAASEGASQIVKKISGKGVKTGGFLIPQNQMHKLIPYKDLLNMKQKNDLLNALQMEKSVHINPTKTQSGGFLGTLSARIGIPLAVEAIKKLTGGSAPQIGAKKNENRGRSAPQIGLPKIPPPFYSYIPYVTGQGVKKRPAKKKAKA